MVAAITGSAPWALSFAAIHLVARVTAPSHLDGPTTGYWASSIASTLHGFGVTYLAMNTMVSGGFWSSTDLTHTTPASEQCCHVYLGYLAADFVPLVWYGILRKDKAWKGSDVYLVHHFLSLWSWGLMLVRGHVHAVAVALLLLEATAPFTNGRWFLSTLGITKGPLYTLNGLAMAVSFLIVRVLLMGGLFVRYVVILREPFFALPVSTWATILGSYAFGYPLQLFWFSKIAKGLLKVLSGKKA